jgi:hypothetical protein
VVEAAKIYIHIGFRRTATTCLQNVVFNRNEGINYIAKTGDNYPKWLIEWHYLDDYAFEKWKEKIKDTLFSLLDGGKINLISSEAFTNTGVIYSQALRIKAIVPDARIIMTLRDPVEMVKSHYRGDVSEGVAHLELKEYLDWKRTPFVIGKRRPIYLPDFFFTEAVDFYKELFGEKNLCILKYEDMVRRPDDFFNQLGSFMGTRFHDVREKLGIRLNEGTSEKKLQGKRADNFLNFIKKHFPAASGKVSLEDLKKDVGGVILDDDTERRLKQYYRGKAWDYY